MAKDPAGGHFSKKVDVHVPPAFTRIAQRVESVLTKLDSTVDLSQIQHLKACYSQLMCPDIDYDLYGKTFTYMYFIKNFWKAACVFLREPPPPAKQVLDVGCGSGAVAIAYLAFLDESLASEKSKIHVTLIDRSRAQLNLAENLIRSIEPELHNLEIVFHFRCTDLQRWQPNENGADLVFLGHVLNENRSNVGLLLEKAFFTTAGNGSVYIIERKDDPIWHEVEQAIAQLAVPCTYGDTRLGMLDSETRKYSRRDAETDITTRYALLSIPKKKQLVDLVRLYFRSWRIQSVESLKQIFAPDAEYYEKPHKPPLCGIEEIEAYWRDNVLPQRNINITILRTAYTHDNAFAEWVAKFTISREAVQLRGTLVLNVDQKTNRVVRLDEYYHSRKHRLVVNNND